MQLQHARHVGQVCPRGHGTESFRPACGTACRLGRQAHIRGRVVRGVPDLLFGATVLTSCVAILETSALALRSSEGQRSPDDDQGVSFGAMSVVSLIPLVNWTVSACRERHKLNALRIPALPWGHPAMRHTAQASQHACHAGLDLARHHSASARAALLLLCSIVCSPSSF